MRLPKFRRRQRPKLFYAEACPLAVTKLFNKAWERFDPRYPNSNILVYLDKDEATGGYLPGYYQVSVRFHFAGWMGRA